MRTKLAAIALFLLFSCAAARAALVKDVNRFLADFDRLVAKRAEIEADRAAMAQHLGDETLLRADVIAFFEDREEVLLLRAAKAIDRKLLKLDLRFKPVKLSKPVSSKDLTAAANSYITSFDQWTALHATVLQNIEQMRTDAAANNETALTASVMTWLTNIRARHAKRLQWQSDVRSLRKIVGFKGAGKAQKPTGTTLSEHVAAFLNDRDEWLTLQTQVEADRNNIRANLSGSTENLRATVITFFTDRRKLRVKGNELALDRKQLRADVGLTGNAKNEVMSGKEVNSKDDDKDDEDNSLDDSPDSAGE